MTIADILANVDRRLGDAHAEITKLEDARTQLLNGAAPATAAASRHRRAKTPKPTKPARAAKPATQVVPAGQLTALLTGSGGLSTRELATAAHGDPAQVLVLLRELETAGDVRRTGERRSTRWHVITDEDRVAARAAELSRQSKRSRARKR